MKVPLLLSGAVLFLTQICSADGSGPLLLRDPSLSRTEIVFSYAGDLWIVSRDGGEARRLTAGPGNEKHPRFSPDGRFVAFTGEYDGNTDVFVVATQGGVPRRLTFHPAPDETVGWSRDGSRVVFRSSRNSYVPGMPRLFTVSTDGGFETEMPLSRADEGSFSPDGTRIAYVPLMQWQRAWKRYRGGQTKPIWIANLGDSRIERKLPRTESNDFNPMWIGQTVYFLSDRNGPVSLFSWDTGSNQVKELIRNTGYDIKSASAGTDAIVYDQFGSLHLYDIRSGKDKTVDVRISADLPEVRPHFQKIEAKRLRSAGISPSGARAVFEARGEIVTAPAEKGDIRNLTNTTAVVERDPAWSPDGKWIAYFSDESGEYALHIRDHLGSGEVKKIVPDGRPGFYYSPSWSPDSKKIAFSDKALNYWVTDLDTKKTVRIDKTTYAGPMIARDLAWSPDSRWIAYAKELRSHLHAIFVYSVAEGKTHQITDGMSDALSPRFDRDGKYLYLTASTDAALANGWLDMSSLGRPITRSVYIVVLRKDLPSPVSPESDDEKPGEGLKGASEKEKSEKSDSKPADVAIDFENIGQRIVSLPIPARNYAALETGKPGILYLVEAPMVSLPGMEQGADLIVHKFDLKTRKTDKLIDGVQAFSISFNGEKMLIRQKDQWMISSAEKPADGPPKPGAAGPVKLADLQIFVDPRAEWKHMYEQVWRNERDFFYDPGLHGVDLNTARKRYAPYVENIACRDDLNYLFEEMLGEMSVGHMFIGGGDEPEVKKVKGGLLGADYKVENGRYRIAHIYGGENWNPKLQAPLTQPGVNVQPGDYVLEVRGRQVQGTDNIYSFFEDTAGKSIPIRVGPNPDGSGSRVVTVVPIDFEGPLRRLSWIEDNRRKVDQMTGGRIAYVYLPDTYAGGYNNFNRYFFAQVGKEGAIIDERYNGGGQLADYIIDHLRRPLFSYFTMREGEDITTPIEGIFGPKVMIVNEMAGSGGDAMPWLFRKSGIGPLIGKRTWGGLVGHYTNPDDLIDGGSTGTPNLAFYTPDGKWEVENKGVAPDIEVEDDPGLIRQGRDPQLEKAIDTVMDLLKKNPAPAPRRPPFPNYHSSTPGASTRANRD